MLFCFTVHLKTTPVINDTSSRRSAKRILGTLSLSSWRQLATTAICMNVAMVIAFFLEHDGLSQQGERALFILIFCAGLWITEAMPAFAVSLLAIGLEISLLGHLGEGQHEWEKYIKPWGSPLIWLFFGGFILAAGAEKTGLDRWVAIRVLKRLGQRPAIILAGIMAATALSSMFVSNTATATMMLAVLSPIFIARGESDRFVKSLLLGIAFAANLGGMGTVIGTPPNAIAAGALETVYPVSFAKWMLLAIPPAILLLTLSWGYITVTYLGRNAFKPVEKIELHPEMTTNDITPIGKLIVIATFAVTVLMWITGPLHNIPTAAVSFIPICTLTAFSILDSDDVKRISWDVLILIAGGLSLGVAIKSTGLSNWIVDQLPVADATGLLIALAFGYMTVALSNLMSNTATANMLIPLAIAILSASSESILVVPIALCASAAMCLPISTPPNAIVYGSQRLKSTDLLGGGILIGLLTPLVVVGWIYLLPMLGWSVK